MSSKYLMKSTSGVRGIIGPGLTATMVTEYGAAFGTILRRKKGNNIVVVGRDSRPSGEHYLRALSAGLQSTGVSVVDVSVIPTPTVEMAVIGLRAKGGVCITASHNPAPWNALKFFGASGEFINKTDFEKLEKALSAKKFDFQKNDKLGSYSSDDSWVEKHIRLTLKTAGISAARVRRAGLTAVVDAVNGAGSYALPEFLRRLGVRVIEINCVPDGIFPHTPEPTPDNIVQLCRAVRKHKANLGLACDPDADRLALVDECGKAIGEELTLALAVRQALSVKVGPVAMNLSTSRATGDVARQMGAKVYLSPVGEANVVAEMKKRGALIGGEGNGGVIYGALHYGRDSLVAAGLVLTLLAREKITMSELAGTVPAYYTIKTKASLPDDFAKRLLKFERSIKGQYRELSVDKRDGVRFDFPQGWIQIRKSNTEPIYRLIVETDNQSESESLVRMARKFFK